ncbi:MAG: hypothetical protein ABFD81_10210 [Syntrophaceae bacterium]|jgi:hypothetical protein
MDANVTLDLGKNMTGLVEKLAATIGTTAQQIFPWYVKQQVISSITEGCIIVSLMVLSLALLMHSLPRADFDDAHNGNSAACVFSGIFLVASVVAAMVAGPSIIAAIINPEYAAMRQLINDLSMLAGK